MPRSKRNKQIELAKTKKRGLEWKKRLYEEVHSCVDKYENVFVFSVNDMRNNKMKTVREQWKHSRFFIGKNKIMAMALGRCAEEEYKPNLHKVGQQIKGQRGLLFSNKPVEEVLSWFRSYSEGDYARSGNTATETVNLPAGPLTMFPHNLEPYLRELGLPTALERGIIQLIKDHEVCKAGDTLTPETAKILKLLGYQMAEFHVTINCVWSKDGTFMQLTENIDNDFKENRKQEKLSLSSGVIEKNDGDDDDDEEEMEIEQNDVEKSVENIDAISKNNTNDDEQVEISVENEKTDTFNVKEVSEKNIDVISEKNKKQVETSIENGKTEDENIIKSTLDEINKDHTEKLLDKTDNKFNMEEVSEKNSDAISAKNEERVETSIESGKTEDENIIKNTSDEINENHTEKLLDKTDNKFNMEEVSEKNSDVISAKTEDKNIIEGTSDEINMKEVSVKNIDVISKKNEEQVQTSKKRRSRVPAKTPTNTKKQKVAKNDSLIKTPDANTSQDSPVFRELRNRSVKVSRRKK